MTWDGCLQGLSGVDHGRVFAVEIRQRHGVDILSAALHAVEVGLCVGIRPIGDNEGLESQVAGCPGGRLHRVVGADADNHERGFSARMQPALKAGVDEGVRYVLLDDVFVRQWRQFGLELHARLAGPERRTGRSGDVANMYDWRLALAPAAQKLRDGELGLVIVADLRLGPGHPNLHIDDYQRCHSLMNHRTASTLAV